MRSKPENLSGCEPLTLKQAMNSPHWPHWKASMESEILGFGLEMRKTLRFRLGVKVGTILLLRSSLSQESLPHGLMVQRGMTLLSRFFCLTGFLP